MVVVPVVVVPVVEPVVVVPVVVAPSTTTDPVMRSCLAHTNVYVPGVSKRHVPLQPGPDGPAGNGGTGPVMGPAVCVHDVGLVPPVKTTLWMSAPSG